MADPPLPSRQARPVMWWGLTPRTVTRAALIAGVLGLLGALVWWLLPAPAPLDVPENFFTDQPAPVAQPLSESSAQAQSTAFVHVAGEVEEPGLVELPSSARVAEAIERAGGATSEADLAAINLAAIVSDGEQVYVPARGEAPSGGDPREPEHGGLVNINTASEAELQGLSGIGPVLATRIVTHRETNGPFSTVDDLQAVSGIGPALMSTLRSEVTV